MKKLLVSLMLVLAFMVPVIAEEGDTVTGKIGGFSFDLLRSNLSFVSMYSFEGRGLIGGEMLVASFSYFRLNGGVVTSFEADGTPYVAFDLVPSLIAAQIPILKSIPLGTGTTFGIFAGYNTDTSRWITGLKASFPLWK